MSASLTQAERNLIRKEQEGIKSTKIERELKPQLIFKLTSLCWQISHLKKKAPWLFLSCTWTEKSLSERPAGSLTNHLHHKGPRLPTVCWQQFTPWPSGEEDHSCSLGKQKQGQNSLSSFYIISKRKKKTSAEENYIPGIFLSKSPKLPECTKSN